MRKKLHKFCDCPSNSNLDPTGKYFELYTHEVHMAICTKSKSTRADQTTCQDKWKNETAAQRYISPSLPLHSINQCGRERRCCKGTMTLSSSPHQPAFRPLRATRPPRGGIVKRKIASLRCKGTVPPCAPSWLLRAAARPPPPMCYTSEACIAALQAARARPRWHKHLLSTHQPILPGYCER